MGKHLPSIGPDPQRVNVTNLMFVEKNIEIQYFVPDHPEVADDHAWLYGHRIAFKAEPVICIIWYSKCFSRFYHSFNHPFVIVLL